jgi:hypothetical protein
MQRRSRLLVVALLVAATTVTPAPGLPPGVEIQIVWDIPDSPPLFDCDNQAWAANNPDKCGLAGPFLLGGGAPRGGGLLGGLLKRLGGLL